MSASSDNLQKEPTKCIARFQNGKQCTYNAKPGRRTCDRLGHSDWETLGTSDSSILDASIDDKMMEQSICTAKYSDGRSCTNKARSGRTTCGIPRHQKYEDKTPGDEIDAQQEKENTKVGEDANDLAGTEGGRFSIGGSTRWLEETEQEDPTVFEQQGSECIETMKKAEGSSVFKLSENSDSTEDSQSAVDREVGKPKCIAKRQYLNERCDQEPESGFQTCKIKSHRDQEPSSPHETQKLIPSATKTSWQPSSPFHFAKSLEKSKLPTKTPSELNIDHKSSSAATKAIIQTTRDGKPTAENAAQVDLGMARLLKESSMFQTLETLQEEINEINRRQQDKFDQSRQLDDLVYEMQQISTKTDKTYMEILRSAQAVVQGLMTVSGGQVNEERFFQEMRALKATMVEDINKHSTSGGRLDEETLAEIKGAVRESRGDNGGRDSRREEEIYQGPDILKTTMEESLGRHQTLNGNILAEIRNVLQAIRNDSGRRDEQREKDSETISLEFRTLKATMEEVLSKPRMSMGSLDRDTLIDIKNMMREMQNDKGQRGSHRDDDPKWIFQEIRALKTTVEETFGNSLKQNRPLSEDVLTEINDALREMRLEKVQRNGLAKAKCQKLKAQRDAQYDIVEKLLGAFVARYRQPL